MAGNGRKSAEAAFVAALATGQTIQEAAKTADIGESTAHRWMKEPDFRKQMQEARSALVMDAVGKLSARMSKAADTLEQLLFAESESVRLGAARSIIELGAKLREQTELEERFAELESRAKSAEVKNG